MTAAGGLTRAFLYRRAALSRRDFRPCRGNPRHKEALSIVARSSLADAGPAGTGFLKRLAAP